IEAVGDPVGGNTVRATGGRVRTDAGLVPGSPLNSLVFVMRNSDEHSEVGPSLEVEYQTRVLNRLPGGLQKQSVLRIHVGRFPRRDPEKLWVELINSLQKPAASSHRLAR